MMSKREIALLFTYLKLHIIHTSLYVCVCVSVYMCVGVYFMSIYVCASRVCDECASVRVCMCKCMPECLQVSVGVYEGVCV